MASTKKNKQFTKNISQSDVKTLEKIFQKSLKNPLTFSEKVV